MAVDQGRREVFPELGVQRERKFACFFVVLGWNAWTRLVALSLLSFDEFDNLRLGRHVTIAEHANHGINNASGVFGAASRYRAAGVKSETISYFAASAAASI
ncbi:hypothetical protein [Bradyrhizobium sp. CSS354]|uniref:hypothetical protein n=1 Tax=Bradyrhizobium sp. CSS354 TaxID=2699172 RepID=UPI0023AF6949|nr:hypothetical protein [Bradyrhizobium sp. CSS354]